jgi:hypothetical protein
MTTVPEPISPVRHASTEVVTPRLLGVRVGRALLVSVGAGALLGASAWFVDGLGLPWSALIPANFVGVWLALAFFTGAAAHRSLTGACYGLLSLLAAVAAYYLLIALFDVGVRVTGASHAATVWGGVALVAGPVMGLAGGVWRHGTGPVRSIAVATLAAGLLAESVVTGWDRFPSFASFTDPSGLGLAAEFAIGLLLPCLLLRRGERLTAYVALVPLGLAGLVVMGPGLTALRSIADTF